MNANRLISMAINMILRRVMRSGIDAGMNAFANRKGQGTDGSAENGAAENQPQGKRGGPNTRATQQRMRKSLRLGRRIGRF